MIMMRFLPKKYSVLRKGSMLIATIRLWRCSLARVWLILTVLDNLRLIACSHLRPRTLNSARGASLKSLGTHPQPSPFGAGGVNRDRKSMAVAQTPKTVGGMGLDLNLSKLQGVPEAEAQDEDTARGKPD
jgi:hypothetical protein